MLDLKLGMKEKSETLKTKSHENYSKYSSKRNLGRKWYNDGIKNYFILPENSKDLKLGNIKWKKS